MVDAVHIVFAEKGDLVANEGNINFASFISIQCGLERVDRPWSNDAKAASLAAQLVFELDKREQRHPC